MPMLPINRLLADGPNVRIHPDQPLLWKLDMVKSEYEREENHKEFVDSAHVMFGEGFIWPNTVLPAEGGPFTYEQYVSKAFGTKRVSDNTITKEHKPVCFNCACDHKLTNEWFESPNQRAGAECHLCKGRSTERYFIILPEVFASINADVIRATLL